MISRELPNSCYDKKPGVRKAQMDKIKILECSNIYSLKIREMERREMGDLCIRLAYRL